MSSKKDNSVTLHLDCIDRNAAGTIFASYTEKVAVLRWEHLEHLKAALDLTENALGEMAAFGLDTLVYDVRLQPEEELQLADESCRKLCTLHPSVRRIAWLTSNTPALPLPPDLVYKLADKGIRYCVAHSFKEGAQKLDALRSGPNAPALNQLKFEHFSATYGGSTYFIPEYRTTVMRTAGNIADLKTAEKVYAASLALYKKTQSIAFIADSTAVPPIEGDQDLPRHVLAYQKLLLPLMTSSSLKTLIHVRAGDSLWSRDAPQPTSLFGQLGIALYEVSVMEEAIEVLRLLKGKCASGCHCSAE